MAPKRSNPIENPPAASSSEEEEEEEESSEEEEEGSSSEEEEEEPKTQNAPLTQKAQPPKKPEAAAPSVAVDESDESDSESESESDTPSPNVKPITTKSIEETSHVKKPRSKPLASSVKVSSVKRANESEQEPKEAKRAKKKTGEEGTAAVVVEEVKKTGEDAKKQLFQRLFSEDDEIAVLKGMLDYSEKNGSDPIADMNTFYDFVKKSIHTDVTKAQLMDKIRRLRKKFENNAKGKKGEDRTFSKPHEQKAFELSKKIWGKDGITVKVESSSAKLNGKAKGNAKPLTELKGELLFSAVKKVDPMEVDKKGSKSLGSLFDKRFGVAGLEEEVLKHGLDMIDGETRAALDAKWRKLQIAELELFLQRNELVKEHAKLMLEFYKSEDK
ncbi:probable transcription factor At1g61730 [Durio zibethinus]|uniref:Probable transcription factor At1g61730 n=1 Tax=Durio zibethinus TaxID=66656 RepID=A0A6P5WPN0_DURZI|nr:probable transcription factor At1g61730 [Durio zibethinus]